LNPLPGPQKNYEAGETGKKGFNNKKKSWKILKVFLPKFQKKNRLGGREAVGG